MELIGLNNSRTNGDSLINEIAYHRSREVCRVNCDDDDYVLVASSKVWLELFIKHFVNNEDITHDDLLFFVKKTQLRGSRWVPKYETSIEVFRYDSKKLPIGNLGIDWEETLYLNVIMQRFEYHLTCAVCSKTSQNPLQILRKRTQRVYATPSHRSMYGKADNEVITYPNIFFTVDNFEEILPDIIVRHGEIFCVELVAHDTSSNKRVALFSGNVQYGSLERAYYVKSLTKNTKHRDEAIYFEGERLVFASLSGPKDKGYAEVTLAKSTKNANGHSFERSEHMHTTDTDWEDLESESRPERRNSETSSSLTNQVRGWQSRRLTKTRSETRVHDGLADEPSGIKSVEEHHEPVTTRSMWSLPGIFQTLPFWKENKPVSSVPLHTAATYVTLPWFILINDLIKSKLQPVLNS
ncbi:Uncharacterized protein HDE_00120 [Halotydeus destructor]|nr:Uncharacterized protein HDE_00120 [Halotydeus destructor]